jgi:hypothetical protein
VGRDLRRDPRGDLGGFPEAVDRPATRLLLECVLDPAETLVDGTPAGVDQVDEQPEVVDARVALCEKLHLDPLEPADRLIREPAHLRELARNGPRFDADALADGVADPIRERGFELGRSRGEGLDLGSRPLERGIDVARLWCACGRLCEPLAGAVESAFVHEDDDSVFAG